MKALGEEFASKQIQVVGQIQFFVVVGLGPCFLAGYELGPLSDAEGLLQSLLDRFLRLQSWQQRTFLHQSPLKL